MRYARGSPDEGMDVSQGGGGFGVAFGDGSAAGVGESNVDGAAAEVDAVVSASSRSPISAAGVAVIAIGAIAMFGVLLAGAVAAARGKGGDGSGDGGGGGIGGGQEARGGGAPSPSYNSRATTFAEFVEDDGKRDDGAMYDDDGESIFSGLSRGMSTVGDRTVMTNSDVDFFHDRDDDDDFTAAGTGTFFRQNRKA